MPAIVERTTGTDHEVMWTNLRRLLDNLVRAVDRGDFLDDCLDALVELLGADRGLILLFYPDGGTQVVNARGRGRSLDAAERSEISRTIVERVRRSGHCLLYKPLEEAHPAESVHALGIATALVAPLHGLAWRARAAPTGGDGPEGSAAAPSEAVPLRGALYLDFRDRRRLVGPLQQEFAEAAANVMAAVLEPHQRLQVVEEHLRALRARPEEAGPDLDELLRPESMRAIRREVRAHLRSDESLFILGESGTGKTELARAIAAASGRTPVVRAMLGAADDLNTIRSELFGHERGAFTGAFAKRTGVVEFADGGTLIFDEILNLPPHAQQILLDFTQYGTYQPIGHEKQAPRRAKVRIFAVTNGDIEAAMREGRFREDLYFRLAGVTLVMPPLRERREDIPGLAEGVLRRIDRSRDWRLSVPLRRALVAEDLQWSGNFRQLEAAIRRARNRALLEDPDTNVLTPRHVEPHDLGKTAKPVSPSRSHAAAAPQESAPPSEVSDELKARWDRLQRERDRLDHLEKDLLAAALDKHSGVLAHAAREVGVGRTSLISRMDTLGLSRPARRPGGRG